MAKVLNQKTIVMVIVYMRERQRGTYLTLSESTFRTVEMNPRWLWEDDEASTTRWFCPSSGAVLMWSEGSDALNAVSTAVWDSGMVF